MASSKGFALLMPATTRVSSTPEFSLRQNFFF
uniref:Uncharacterized protein n=1 Tax=Rhizophora mucronata TaxID=61149 RepID=A0A2P2IRD2_RHIMU